jgi:2-isopropylmalate synthase
VINPAQVGNSRLLGVDDASLIVHEMWELGLYTKEREDVAKKVLARMRELEAFGCKFENAKASLHLLILDSLGITISPFQVRRWETSTSRTMNDASVNATIEVGIAEQKDRAEKILSASAKGVGPIHAVDLALRKCLEQEFSELQQLKLISYSLNIVDSLSGSAATARARTEFSDEAMAYTGTSPSTTWATTAVSEDVLDASIKALIDGYRYKLIFRSKSEKYTLPDWKIALSWRYSERC